MHYLAKILFSKTGCSNSLEARQYVEAVMQTDVITKVVGDCYDSFKIGGGWSGILTTDLLDQEKLLNYAKNYEKKSGRPLCRTLPVFSPSDSDIENITLAKEMFYEYFPSFEGEVPFFRNEFSELGYKDDVAIIENERMYYRWVGKFEGRSHYSDFDSFQVIDLDGAIISLDNTVNKKWIVVVDCHR